MRRTPSSMPDCRIVVSRAADARLAAAGEWLDGRLRHAGEALVTGSGWGSVTDFLRVFARRRGGALGSHRATLGQLAAELAAGELSASGRAPVGALGMEAVARRAVASVAGDLERFAAVAATEGFPAVLASTLRELRLAGAEPEGLAAAGSPGRDLARLLAAYGAELDRWRLADAAATLRIATAVAGQGGHRLLGMPLLLLDVPLASSAELALVSALAARAPAVLASVPAGDVQSLEALRRALAAEPEDLDEVATGASRLERLRRFVFTSDPPVGPSGAADADPSFAFLAAPGEGREAAEIARRIRDLGASGVRFDEMAVLLRDPEASQPALEEAFERAGIPAWYSRGTVRPDPAGRALLALLACAAESLSASRFAEYLSLGQVPGGDEPAGASRPSAGAASARSGVPARSAAPPVPPWVQPEDEALALKPASVPEVAGAGAADDAVPGSLPAPRQWERLLTDAAVIGGRDRWERRLDGLAAELRAHAALHAAEDEAARAEALADRERLDRLRAFALPLIGALGALPIRASWGVWLDELTALARAALRRPQRPLAVLAELRPLADVGPVGLEEVRRTLAPRLSRLRSEPPQSRGGRVFVATPAEARGRSFAAVFLPGMAEGSFPRRAAEDPLLLDTERRALGLRLATQAERVAGERLLLRLAIGAARERLVVSYPSLDLVQGRPRVPSFYALDVLRAAEGRLPDARELERRAVAEAGSILGWPAPRAPERAIDDAEFDIAVLEPLLSRPPAAGAGRFLLEGNPWLARSLRNRWARWSRAFHPADGLVDPGPEALNALVGNRLGARSYSPTALETFAACPYRFLLHAVQRLRPREAARPLERLDPRTRGSLFHDTQFELLTALAADGLLPIAPERLAATLDRLDDSLDRVAARYAEQLAPAVPRVFRDEVENLRIDLRGWVREVAEEGQGWLPVHFELAFGIGADSTARLRAAPQDAASRSEPAAILAGYRLRGRIDLVEERPAGGLRVTDHKTGAPPRERRLVVGGGERLQPLLYALAAEATLGRPVEAGRLFFCTRRGNYEERQVELDPAARQAAAHALAIVDQHLAAGFLPAAPRADACAWCDFRPVCGPHEELRTARKPRERLVDLDRLRAFE